MKQLLTFLVLIIVSFTAFADEHYAFEMQGFDPENKKYSFEVSNTTDLNISEYQYQIWKLLKNKGYELVPREQAELIIYVTYYPRQEDRQESRYVKIGEKTTQVMGANVPIPVWSSETANFTITENIINIKALDRDASELSIPYWQIGLPQSMAQTVSLTPMYLSLFMSKWNQSGSFDVMLKYNNKGVITKASINGSRLLKNDLTDLQRCVEYLTDRSDIQEYNRNINQCK